MMWLFAIQALFVGNQACRPCHVEIFEAYSMTPMAGSSGRVADDVAPGVLRHEASGIEYRIERNGSVTLAKGSARQQRTLEYFIGSGTAGRTYLYTRQGFLFEAPVTWYSQRGAWDRPPGFESAGESRGSRPVEPSSLSCHASQLRAVSSAQNQYGL